MLDTIDLNLIKEVTAYAFTRCIFKFTDLVTFLAYLTRHRRILPKIMYLELAFSASNTAKLLEVPWLVDTFDKDIPCKGSRRHIGRPWAASP